MASKPHLIIVGRGKLAQAIVRQCKKQNISHSVWEKKSVRAHTVLLYCGSNRLWRDVQSFCRDSNVPLVLLSTNVTLPKKPRFPFVYVPNASREVRQFMQAVSEFAHNTSYDTVTILESHQRGKKDVSGTARQIARELGRRESIITSVRNPSRQRTLGIPKRYLDGHAYHRVTFTHNGVVTEFTVCVLGRETYARGAIEIARELLKTKQRIDP